MTEKKVIISISGMQTYEGLDRDSSEFVTSGIYTTCDNGDSFLRYRESELTGLGNTETTFHVAPDRVEITRTGEVNTHMLFKEGTKYFSMYKSPVGTVTVGVNTQSLTKKLREDGGDIEITYATDIDRSVIGVNIVKVRFQESGNAPVQ